MPKVSVIIPIYNTQNYLEKCLDSVCNQTFKDIEIICINDCSTDNSLAILKEYAAKKDNLIKIIDLKENKGLSNARNTGLKSAEGEYIYFLDSDDWIKSDFIEEMYNAITINNQKAVCCTNILTVFEDGTTTKFIKRDFKEKFVPYSHSCQMAWSWLLKKTFLNEFNMIFPYGLKYEDFYFFYVVIRSLEQVYVINSTTYYHLENKNSIMGKAKNRTINDYDIIENLRLIYNFYKKNNKINTWSLPFFYMPKYMLHIHKNKNEFYKHLKNFFNEIKNDVIGNLNLYSKLEINFYNDVLSRKNYQEYKNLDISLIATLSKNI